MGTAYRKCRAAVKTTAPLAHRNLGHIFFSTSKLGLFLFFLKGKCEKRRRDPRRLESLDDNPVRIEIPLMTPKGMENKHLKVFSSIGKVFSDDPKFQERLIQAKTPAEVYDLLQSKEVCEINYFMDDRP